MSRKKRTHNTKHMPSDEQMKASGIRELTAEELLKVNGGGQVEGAGPVCGPAPDIPDDPPSSGSSSSGGSLSGGSESSSGSSSSGNSSGGSSSNSGSSGGGNGSSGGSSGTNDSSPPPSSTPSEPVTGGNSDDTGGGYTDYPEAGYIDYQESGGSSGGGSSNGSSGSSDNHSSDSGNADSGYSDDSWGGSSDNDSSDSGGSYTGGSYTGGGFTYTPPVHNQEPSAPSPIEETVEETQNVQENTGVTSSLPQKPTSEQDTRPPERLKDRFNTANEGREGIHGIFKNMKDNAVETWNRLKKKEQPKAIGVDDDQYKIPEQLNRQKGVIVSFDKSEEKLKVNSYRKLENGDWQLTRTYTIDAHNNVRNELNQRREAPDVTTCPKDGSEAQWYFPRQFPNGTWELGLSRKSNSSNVEGVFIPTTAYQDVPVYGPKSSSKPIPDANGNYIATGVQSDTGYGIHFAKGTTWGCIGLKSISDAMWLAKITDSALLSTNGFARLRVQE
ncbi:hypothetical protein V1L52_07670 [Treponema sp. HNW]|uniref:hypothetical protein n=1 Tax=Treponema sp. HNW TaxID=3116654 RepID=UPI003D0A5CFD